MPQQLLAFKAPGWLVAKIKQEAKAADVTMSDVVREQLYKRYGKRSTDKPR